MAKKKKSPWPTKLSMVTIRLFEEDLKQLKLEAAEEGMGWQMHMRRRLHKALKSKGVVA